MTARSPKVGLIGAGNWGINHLRVWTELGHLAVVCDTSEARLSQIGEQYPQVATTVLVDEVLDDPSIDGVVIATPASTHAELAIRALEAGKAVYVEKPMTLSVVEAEKVEALVRKDNSVLMVGHVLEFHPAFLKLRQMVEDGELGKVRYLYSHRLNFGKVRTEENALWSFAPHDIALLLRLLDDLPEKVSCQGGSYLTADVADITMMNLSFPGGVKAHIFVSWLHPFKEHRFVVVGDQQMAVFDDTAPWPEKLVVYPHRVDWKVGKVPVASKASAVNVPLDEAEPLTQACLHFVDCIKKGSVPLTDAQSGLKVLRILETAERSLASDGIPVRADAGPSDGVFIHPSASVDTAAEIGDGTKIWHHSHVMAAAIGRSCILGQNVFVGPGVRIGNGVKIQNNVSVYAGVELEDYVFCGPSMVFTNVINPRSEIERKSEFLPTLVKRGATLGANCTIVCGNAVGEYAMVAAGAVVTKDVPAYALVAGVPARPLGWVCRCAERLTLDDDSATCTSCGRFYRLEEGRLVPAAA